MILYWQEIITAVIILSTLFFLIKKLFFKKDKRISNDAGINCKSPYCDDCAVLDLKQEIEKKKIQKEDDNNVDASEKENWEKNLIKEIDLRIKKLK